jgi:DNA processing protein
MAAPPPVSSSSPSVTLDSPVVETIGLFDPAYPARLRELSSVPDTLRVRGVLPVGRGVAIVGTRGASPDGEAFARYLAGRLISFGVAVWSGGARGIDRAAHEGALEADGVTVLVSGAGIDVVYPPESKDLYDRVPIRGAVVSLSPDGATPRAFSLLARNEVLAAMTDATVLVECPLKSGARSTSAAARRLGRPTFIATQPPWSPFAAAVTEEVRLGAQRFDDVETLLRALVPPPAAPPLSAMATQVIAVLEAGPAHLDTLCEALSLPPSAVAAALTELSVHGRVQDAGAGRHVLT